LTQYLFRNFEMLDPERDEVEGGFELLVEDRLIKEVSDRPLAAAGAEVVDCGGRTLMPGLIDCHVHVVLSEVSLGRLEAVPLTLMTARAMHAMQGMLDRGFTAVRDTGGADWGLKTFSILNPYFSGFSITSLKARMRKTYRVVSSTKSRS
jgi:imidazolonepropionase-like amidohydrolase